MLRYEIVFKIIIISNNISYKLREIIIKHHKRKFIKKRMLTGHTSIPRPYKHLFLTFVKHNTLSEHAMGEVNATTSSADRAETSSRYREV